MNAHTHTPDCLASNENCELCFACSDDANYLRDCIARRVSIRTPVAELEFRAVWTFANTDADAIDLARLDAPNISDRCVFVVDYRDTRNTRDPYA